jgi:hypothetical protein
MLRESNCNKRDCKWYKGVKQPNGDELWEFHYCNAFPDGIPREINEGEDLHFRVYAGQKGNYIYSKRQ